MTPCDACAKPLPPVPAPLPPAPLTSAVPWSARRRRAAALAAHVHHGARMCAKGTMAERRRETGDVWRWAE